LTAVNTQFDPVVDAVEQNQPTVAKHLDTA
jgi:hypothetical protein